MSTTVNGAGAGSSSKAPESEVGFQPQNRMAVQPPKQEDLQRSYATVVSADANPKGWYGTMSKFAAISFVSRYV
jgi:hypothetical protein